MLKRDDVPEFVGQIIDIFEDFLEERNIVLHNDEREQPGTDAAIIYGTDYGQLRSYIERTLENWGLINSNNAEHIVEAAFVSVWDGGYEVATPCRVNTRTREVFDIGVSEGTAEMVNELEEEFIRFEDGMEYPVEERESAARGAFWYK